MHPQINSKIDKSRAWAEHELMLAAAHIACRLQALSHVIIISVLKWALPVQCSLKQQGCSSFTPGAFCRKGYEKWTSRNSRGPFLAATKAASPAFGPYG